MGSLRVLKACTLHTPPAHDNETISTARANGRKIDFPPVPPHSPEQPLPTQQRMGTTGIQTTIFAAEIDGYYACEAYIAGGDYMAMTGICLQLLLVGFQSQFSFKPKIRTLVALIN